MDANIFFYIALNHNHKKILRYFIPFNIQKGETAPGKRLNAVTIYHENQMKVGQI